MDVQLLTQADFILSKCGRPVAPAGLSVVYVPKGFSIQQFFPVSPLTPTQTVVKEITGDTAWCMRSIQFTSSTVTALSIQIQLPNGKFLISNLQDALQIAGYGSYRYVFTRELECPPGSRLQVTFQDTNTAVAQPMSILFDGAYKYFLKSGAQGLPPSEIYTGPLPRYTADPNQNIMAPCWQQGVGPKTPAGFLDQEYVYAAPAKTAVPVAGPFTATQEITIDSSSDFKARRLLFAVTADDTVNVLTPPITILCRLRTGSGYALTDDYLDVATYVNGLTLPKTWDLPAGDSVYIDMQLVNDNGGAMGEGNVYLQTYIEGVKRYKKLA